MKIAKIGGAMLVSLITAVFLSKELFIASTPRVRPHLDQYIVKKITVPVIFFKSIVRNTGQLIPSFRTSPVKEASTGRPGQVTEESPQALMQSIQNIPLDTEKNGIYTKEDTHTRYLLIKEQEVEWFNTTMTVNGKNYVVQVPRGEQAPSVTVMKSTLP